MAEMRGKFHLLEKKIRMFFYEYIFHISYTIATNLIISFGKIFSRNLITCFEHLIFLEDYILVSEI